VIPGYLMQSKITVTDPSVLVGSNTVVTVSIPGALNATASVTVYVTNGNPAAVTLNGSAAAVIPVVFATGATNGQNLNAVGRRLGVAPSPAGGAGLTPSKAALTVLPPSGLMGRWVNGTENLLDKSGYSPAGTHDGVMPVGFTATFTADVP